VLCPIKLQKPRRVRYDSAVHIALLNRQLSALDGRTGQADLFPTACRASPSYCCRDCGARGNLPHSWLSKASLAFAGGFPETVAPGFGKIQPHSLHPQAAKVKSSSQINSLAILAHLNCRGVQYCSHLVWNQI